MNICPADVPCPLDWCQAAWLIVSITVGFLAGRRTLRPARLIKVGDPDPANRCPTCAGTGRRRPSEKA